MKVSIDGLRRALGTAYNEAVAGYARRDDDALYEALWDLRRLVGGMMCIYSSDPEDQFSDMSDLALELAEPGEPGEREKTDA